MNMASRNNPVRSHRSLLTALVLAPALLIAAGACGVPTGEDSFSEIPGGEVLFDLDATSTSTSSTTTTTTLPEAPTTTDPEATTTPIRLDPVEIFFLSRGRLQRIELGLPTGFSPDQVADILEAGPPEDVALDTLIEKGLIVSSVESEGVLTVDLDREIFRRIASFDQAEAIGQILMTMISSLRRVGQVAFTLDGVPTAVKKGNNLLADVGEALSYDDYVVLLAEVPASPRTTGTTVAPTTSED